MTFFKPRFARGSFTVHWTRDPIGDFGVWAQGYKLAAQRLAQSLVDEPSFPDYEGYSAFFLYRHALELYLKAIVTRGGELSQLRDKDAVLDKLRLDHKLPPLAQTAVSVLQAAFPADNEGIEELRKALDAVVHDIHSVDPDSFVFRYPINKQLERPVGDTVGVNLFDLMETMDSLLERLDTVCFAIEGEVEVAQDVLRAYFDF